MYSRQADMHQYKNHLDLEHIHSDDDRTYIL